MVERLGLEEFGTRLVDSLDLDPVYVALHHSDLTRQELIHWLLAYWCYYHGGTSSWISSGYLDPKYPTGWDYWDRMKLAAGSKDYPRGHERRHFRGKFSIRSVEWLALRGVEALFQPLLGADTDLATVMAYVTKWYGFGPWISFKVPDMLERLGLAKIRFPTQEVFLFDSPKEGAERAWEAYGTGSKPEDLGGWATGLVLRHLGSRLAPPGFDRGVNAQEAETVLCKWKSHLNGHYTLGEDIRSLRTGLVRFSFSPISQRLLKAGKVGGLW